MNVREQLAQILESPIARQYPLTGFYLEPHDLAAIRDLLTPDDPDTGASGRFAGVPVFAKGSKIPFDDCCKQASLGTIDFTFVAQGHWDLGQAADE